MAASGMIDLHSHLLYSVDDGASTLEESLALASIAVADGIHTSVLTPHIHPGRYQNSRSSLLGKVLKFQGELDAAGIPLQLRLGGEVRLSIESLDLILEGEAPFLGSVAGYRILLLEFPHQMIPVGSQQFIEKLLAMKIRPLIAHPERNKAVMAQPERIRGFVDSGCWLQVTAGSVAGRFGEHSRQVATWLVKNDLVHVLASDAHNAEHRPPVLSDGRNAIATLIGESKAWDMVRDHPAQIIANT
ncbi:MAG: CpsB/CapC family capsule biosynthesis tyrosine phosphatase [Azonexus sp.]